MTGDEFRILFVADVVGHPGREAVKAILPSRETLPEAGGCRLARSLPDGPAEPS